jgi:hypothetical protein
LENREDGSGDVSGGQMSKEHKYKSRSNIGSNVSVPPFTSQLHDDLSKVLYSTIACTLAEPEAINFNVEAAVELIVKITENPIHSTNRGEL